MPQTGKTSKKQVSSAQQAFKAASQQQRLENLADIADWISGAKTGFGIRPTARYLGPSTLTKQAKKQAKAESEYRRIDQQAGRMSFTKDRKPYALPPKMNADGTFQPGYYGVSQLKRYVAEKHRDVRWGNPSVASEALDRVADRLGIGSRTTPLTKAELEFIQAGRGGMPLPQSPVAAGRSMAGKAPVTRNRARGRSVSGMMSMGAGLGIGQILRGMMNKEQPKRK